MDSWISWLAVGCMIAVVCYAVFSMFLRKPVGLYIAAAFHIVLGIWSLPSIGLYLLGLAVLEFITGVIMTVKFRRTRIN